MDSRLDSRDRQRANEQKQLEKEREWMDRQLVPEPCTCRAPGKFFSRSVWVKDSKAKAGGSEQEHSFVACSKLSCPQIGPSTVNDPLGAIEQWNAGKRNEKLMAAQAPRIDLRHVEKRLQELA